MTYEYLSQALTKEDLRLEKLNLIAAPCGTGKSQFAITELSKISKYPEHVVYLIDTVAGQEQLAKRYPQVHVYTKEWREYLQHGMIQFIESHVCLMTYAKFGALVTYYPQFVQQLELVICDELHNLFWPIRATEAANANNEQSEQNENYNLTALKTLQQLVYGGKCYVVGMTATPSEVYDNFYTPIYDLTHGLSFVDRSPLHRYTYQSLELILERMEQGKHYLVYMKHIHQMKECVALLESRGFHAMALWSMKNTEHPFTEEQMALRTYILEHEQLPDDLDVLIINKACETCINLRGKIEAAFIHTKNEDIVTQACGRYRGRLNAVYIYSQDEVEIDIPVRFLNRRLYTEDKEELAELLWLCNKNGRQYKWRTIKKHLFEQGYSIQERKQSKRFAIITPPSIVSDP